MSETFIHQAAIVETKVIGAGTRVWAFVHILPNAVIGEDCNICDHCFIENDVLIGNRVTVKSGIYIWDGARIADDVFLGPNVVFTNDVRPRSKQYDRALGTITIEKGATIGANATLLPDITIGAYALVGAGSVVTKNVPAHALVYGNPARINGWVDEQGSKLQRTADGIWLSPSGAMYEESSFGLKRKS